MQRYRSKFEATIAKTVADAAYEPTKIKFVQPAKTRTYTPDFVLPNGIMVEAKGRLTASDRQKMLWVRDQHPTLDIRFVFQSAHNRISKTSKTTYAAWADANGFRWAAKTIPQDWIDETAKEAETESPRLSDREV